MKHSASRDLFAYWNAQRGNQLAPERADIEPGAIRSVLGDTFILAFDRSADHPFRLAGTRVCALFCRELKNTPFIDLWEPSGRAALRELVGVVAQESTGIVASVSGRTADRSVVDLELLLLPLRHRGGPPGRLLGVLAPMEIPYWLGVRPAERLALGMLRHVGAGIDTFAPRILPGDQAARRREGLTVYDGGLAETVRD